MKVSRLIAELLTFGADEEVYIYVGSWCDDGDLDPIESVRQVGDKIELVA